MKKNLLIIENAATWSWGIHIWNLFKGLFAEYHIFRVVRQVGEPFDACLLEQFNTVLVQNVDTLESVTYKKNLIGRIGGMLIKEPLNTRYDSQLSQCSAVIATSNELKAIADRVNKNVHLIPNGVDLKLFCPPAKPVEKKLFTIGFAGNIWGHGLDYKGYKYVIEASLRMWGEIGIKTCLHAHTQIPHDEMPSRFYHLIDALVLPSIGEGCSNVVMEALACGVPVLLTKVGFHGEMLVDGENCLFISRDTSDIIEKIKRLKSDGALRLKLSVNGRAFAEQHHDIKVIAAQYAEIIKTFNKE